ncbi:hypothetical protein [Nonomuraea helvata]|uniref:Uncharacterized protein n=1 Tax=Nonomuraea helvata TaxID=37484 RepID=A0ABV5RY75_9ACTN
MGRGGRHAWGCGWPRPGLAVAVGGLLAGWRWVALMGLVAYAVGGLAVLAPLVDALRRRRPHTGASWMLGAAIVWFELTLAANLVVIAARPAAEVAAALEPLLPLVLVGFVGQVLLGSLLHLLPAVLGGGPAFHKCDSPPVGVQARHGRHRPPAR